MRVERADDQTQTAGGPRVPTNDELSAAAAHELFTEHEMARAQRTVTGQLFHYTKAAAAAIILTSGSLRISPYRSTNDLWETEPQRPAITGPPPEEVNASFALWDEIDRHLRLHAKVGCLTQDILLPPDISNRDALRGWAHLSSWAHYGERYAGVCLRFDRSKLVQSFLRHASPTAFAFHGPVRYLSGQNAPSTTDGIDFEQVAEFGVDAVALAYAAANKDVLYFRKHIDWASEAEYRLVLLNQSTDYGFIDIREAVTGVILGSAFPHEHLRDIEEAIEPYPGIDLECLWFHNRRLYCAPFESPPSPPPQPPARAWPARRDGSLGERLLALGTAEVEAETKRQDAASLAADILNQLIDGASELELQLRSMPGTSVSTFHPRVTAVPVELRARRPGVPGEVIHYESGFLCAVEHLLLRSHTLTAAAAVQVLDREHLRLHAVVDTEQAGEAGPRRKELWRCMREIEAAEAEAAVAALLGELAGAVQDAQPSFDNSREASSAQPPRTIRAPTGPPPGKRRCGSEG
ncbi:DUF2971 domain-containing protein [Streptomyces sp. NPDC059991]|uniref:DUF2971 domain-containing protein n=1 Tax=Streptomyces sp. NPDC059991 TaxID=3347028 RepID=UPI0036B65719